MAAASETLCAVLPPAAFAQAGKVKENLTRLAEAGFLVADRRDAFLSEPALRALSAGRPERARALAGGPTTALLLRRQGSGAADALRAIEHELDVAYFSQDAFETLRDERLLFPRARVGVLESTVLLAGSEAPHVERALEAAGFSLLASKLLKPLSPETAAAAAAAGDEAKGDESKGDAAEVAARLRAGGLTALLVEKEDAVAEAALLVGPADADRAARVAPSSLRAQMSNAWIWAAPSHAAAQRAAAALFPEPLVAQRSLALLLPHAAADASVERAVLEALESGGFAVLASTRLYLSKHRCEELFPAADAAWLAQLSAGAALALVVAKPNAVRALQALAGAADPRVAASQNPNSLRARFGVDAAHNALHCSANEAAAEREIRALLPQLACEQLPTRQQVRDMLTVKEAPRPNHEAAKRSFQETLVAGLTHLCRTKPRGADAIRQLALWLLANNPNQPRVDVGEAEALAQSAEAEAQLRAAFARTRVVLAQGLPEARVEERCRQAAEQLGASALHVLSFPALVKAHRNHPQFSERVQESARTGRALPADTAVQLLLRGARDHLGKSRSLVVAGFPQSLDQALALEAETGAAASLLWFDAPTAAAGGIESPAAHRLLDELVPALEHFRTFKRLRAVEPRDALRASLFA